jgi:hypothetical protein
VLFYPFQDVLFDLLKVADAVAQQREASTA